MKTITLPAQFVDDLIVTIHAYASSMYAASEVAYTASKIQPATNLHRDELKRLGDTLDTTATELFDVAMTINHVADESCGGAGHEN